MRIINGKLLTMEGKVFEKGYVDFENGKITAVGALSDALNTNDEVIDAEGGYILPGLIDAHTHIGANEEGSRWEGNDINERTDPLTPQMRVWDGFYPFDTAIQKAVDGGVTSCAISPGSANVIGGQIAAVKLFGKCIDDMLIKAPSAMKFAMGENPKNAYGQTGGKTPYTRMATASLIREALTKAQRYMEKKEKGGDDYDAKCEALIPVLKREIPAQFHAHRSDDILTAMRIAKEFNIKYTIIHATDSVAILPYIKSAGIIPIVGPSLGPSRKIENRSVGFSAAKELSQNGIEVAITTDHSVLPLSHLAVFAALCVREGMDIDAALRAITINSAKAACIDDRVGSLKVGKDADIAIFDRHPFELMAHTKQVYICGIRVK